ncbi:MAG: hypothetical protein ACOYXT_07460 [Bacteroidota bacterium]
MMFRNHLLAAGFIISLIGCAEKKYEVSAHFSEKAQDSVIYRIIRYAAKLPPQATHETKFNAEYDAYYQTVAADFDIRAYYTSDDSTLYFFLTKPARSITPMREGIGVKLKVADSKLIEYEEVFRTWKMPDAQLNERFPELFEAMVEGETLEPYYTKNAGDKYIEFPDGRFYFDKNARKWRDKLLDSLKVDPH